VRHFLEKEEGFRAGTSEMVSEDISRCKKDLGSLDWILPPKAWIRLEEYVSLLNQWSSRVNLISRRDRNQLATKHLAPALLLLPLILSLPHRTLLDLGSGAGLPGIPLKIALPDTQFYLVESRRKRVTFLREVVRKLELKKVEVVNSRIEDWAFLGGRIDLAVSRAVAGPEILRFWVTPHLAAHGSILTTLGVEKREWEGGVFILVKREEGREKGGTLGLMLRELPI